MRLFIRGSLTGIAVLVVAGSAFAQALPRTRGTIVSITGDDAVLQTPMGHMNVHMAAGTGVVGAKQASLADIKSNSFIGTAAVPASGGKLRALEVTIFPEAMRGAGEGSYPWDLGKSGSMTNGAASSMTNGTVSNGSAHSSMTNGTVSTMGGNGRTIQVIYKGGQQTVELPSNIPVVTLEPGDKSMLKSGAKVVAFGPVSGTEVDAKRIIVGLDGVKPPM